MPNCTLCCLQEELAEFARLCMAAQDSHAAGSSSKGGASEEFSSAGDDSYREESSWSGAWPLHAPEQGVADLALVEALLASAAAGGQQTRVVSYATAAGHA